MEQFFVIMQSLLQLLFAGYFGIILLLFLAQGFVWAMAFSLVPIKISNEKGRISVHFPTFMASHSDTCQPHVKPHKPLPLSVSNT